MKALRLIASAVAVVFVTGCQSLPPGAERGPGGTMAYYVPVESSEPGARVEVNGEYVGDTPVTIKIFGDKDGTFHDFGSYEFVVQAFPVRTNQFVQTRVFRTGRMFTPEDTIPRQIYFDLNQPPPVTVQPPAVYHYHYGPPPPYYYYHYYHHHPRIYHSPGLRVVPRGGPHRAPPRR